MHMRASSAVASASAAPAPSRDGASTSMATGSAGAANLRRAWGGKRTASTSAGLEDIIKKATAPSVPGGKPTGPAGGVNGAASQAGGTAKPRPFGLRDALLRVASTGLPAQSSDTAGVTAPRAASSANERHESPHSASLDAHSSSPGHIPPTAAAAAASSGGADGSSLRRHARASMTGLAFAVSGAAASRRDGTPDDGTSPAGHRRTSARASMTAPRASLIRAALAFDDGHRRDNGRREPDVGDSTAPTIASSSRTLPRDGHERKSIVQHGQSNVAAASPTEHSGHAAERSARISRVSTAGDASRRVRTAATLADELWDDDDVSFYQGSNRTLDVRTAASRGTHGSAETAAALGTAVDTQLSSTQSPSVSSLGKHQQTPERRPSKASHPEVSGAVQPVAASTLHPFATLRLARQVPEPADAAVLMRSITPTYSSPAILQSAGLLSSAAPANALGVVSRPPPPPPPRPAAMPKPPPRAAKPHAVPGSPAGVHAELPQSGRRRSPALGTAAHHRSPRLSTASSAHPRSVLANLDAPLSRERRSLLEGPSSHHRMQSPPRTAAGALAHAGASQDDEALGQEEVLDDMELHVETLARAAATAFAADSIVRLDGDARFDDNASMRSRTSDRAFARVWSASEEEEESASSKKQNDKRKRADATAAAASLTAANENTAAMTHNAHRHERRTKAQVVADVSAFVRGRLRELLVWPWFDRIILASIGISCVFLAVDAPDVDPASARGLAVFYSQIVFTTIFALEAAIKMMALGVHPVIPDSYFRSGWNCIDFAVVTESLVSLSAAGNSSFGALRAVRALRPLRTITRIKGLRTIVNALLHSLPLLANIAIVMIFFFFFFGVVAVQLWRGTFHRTCTFANTLEVVEPGVPCSSDANCDVGQICAEVGEAPAGGKLHFDNILSSMNLLFTCVGREGWTTVMNYAQDVTTPWTWMFFAIVIVLGSFVLVNLTLAVIMQSYEESRARQESESRRNLARLEALTRVRKVAMQRLRENEKRAEKLRKSAAPVVRMPSFSDPDGKPRPSTFAGDADSLRKPSGRATGTTVQDSSGTTRRRTRSGVGSDSSPRGPAVRSSSAADAPVRGRSIPGSDTAVRQSSVQRTKSSLALDRSRRASGTDAAETIHDSFPRRSSLKGGRDAMAGMVTASDRMMVRWHPHGTPGPQSPSAEMLHGPTPPAFISERSLMTGVSLPSGGVSTRSSHSLPSEEAASHRSTPPVSHQALTARSAFRGAQSADHAGRTTLPGDGVFVQQADRSPAQAALLMADAERRRAEEGQDGLQASASLAPPASKGGLRGGGEDDDDITGGDRPAAAQRADVVRPSSDTRRSVPRLNLMSPTAAARKPWPSISSAAADAGRRGFEHLHSPTHAQHPRADADASPHGAGVSIRAVYRVQRDRQGSHSPRQHGDGAGNLSARGRSRLEEEAAAVYHRVGSRLDAHMLTAARIADAVIDAGLADAMLGTSPGGAAHVEPDAVDQVAARAAANLYSGSAPTSVLHASMLVQRRLASQDGDGGSVVGATARDAAERRPSTPTGVPVNSPPLSARRASTGAKIAAGFRRWLVADAPAPASSDTAALSFVASTGVLQAVPDEGTSASAPSSASMSTLTTVQQSDPGTAEDGPIAGTHATGVSTRTAEQLASDRRPSVRAPRRASSTFGAAQGVLTRIEDLVCPPTSAAARCWRAHVSDLAFLITQAPLFSWAMGACIFANTIILAIQYRGMPAYYEDALVEANFAFTFIFLGEMVLKLLAQGLSGYLSDGFNVFDMIVVVLSLVDALVPSVTVGVSVFRLARALRILRLAHRWQSMQVIVAIAIKTLPSFGWTAILLLLALFIFSVLGLQLMGQYYISLSPDDVPQINFSSLHHSVLAVFQLLVGESMDQIIQSHMAIVNDAIALYFIVWIVVGQYILLNLFLALLLAGFTEADPVMQLQERKDEARTAAVLVAQALDELQRRQAALSPVRTRKLFQSAFRNQLLRKRPAPGSQARRQSPSRRPELQPLVEQPALAADAAKSGDAAASARRANDDIYSDFARASIVPATAAGIAALADATTAHSPSVQEDPQPPAAPLAPAEASPAASTALQAIADIPDTPALRALLLYTDHGDVPVTIRSPSHAETTTASPHESVSNPLQATVTPKRHQAVALSMPAARRAVVVAALRAWAKSVRASHDAVHGLDEAAPGSSPSVQGDEPPRRTAGRTRIRSILIANRFVTNLWSSLAVAATPANAIASQRSLPSAQLFRATGAKSPAPGSPLTVPGADDDDDDDEADDDDDEGGDGLPAITSFDAAKRGPGSPRAASGTPTIESIPFSRRLSRTSDAGRSVRVGSDVGAAPRATLRRLARSAEGKQRPLATTPEWDAPAWLTRCLGPRTQYSLFMFPADGWLRRRAKHIANPSTALFHVPHPLAAMDACLRCARRATGSRGSAASPGPADGAHAATATEAGLPVTARQKSPVVSVGFPVSMESIALATIMLSCVMLALDGPDAAALPGMRTTTTVLEPIILTVFIVEMLVKIVAQGLVLGPTAYLRDTYGALDFIVVSTSFIHLIMAAAQPEAELGIFRVFRILRVLRPLRLIARNRGMRLVIDALYYSMTPILNILAVLLLLWSMFAIAGMQLFSGLLDDCNDPDFPEGMPLAMCNGTFTDANNKTVARVVAPDPQNFDNFPRAMLHLFITSTGEDWPAIMYRVGSISGAGLSAIRDNTWYFSYYHVLFIFVAVFIGLNLFIATVYTNFVTLKRSMDGFGLLTERQREWVESQLLLLRAAPIKVIARPRSTRRRVLWELAQHRVLRWSMDLVIAVNMILLATEHWRQPRALDTAIDATNVLFVFVLVVEMVIKLGGFGTRAYFRDRWHVVDAALVVLGVVDIIVTFAAPTSGTAATLHIIRVARGVRLVRSITGIRILLDTLIAAGPSFINVGAVVSLTMFCFAVIGVNLYGDMDLSNTSALDGRNNFRSVPNAVMLMLRTSTGEGWDTLMWDTADPSLGGGPHAYVYWIAYVTLVNFITLQMFILVIVESYETLERQRRGITTAMLQKFRVIWRIYDPQGTGFMDAHDLHPFLHKLGPPMGVRDGTSFSEFMRYAERLNVMTWGGRVAFLDVLLAVHRSTYGIGMPRRVVNKLQTAPGQVQRVVTEKLHRKVYRAQATRRVVKAVAAMTSRRDAQQEGMMSGTLSPRTAITDSPRHSAPMSDGDRRRAAFRMSKVQRESWLAVRDLERRRMAAVAPMSSPFSQWLQGNSLVASRTESRQQHALALHLEAERRAEERRAAIARRAARRADKDAARRRREERLQPWEPQPLSLVIRAMRIQRSFREWKGRNRMHAHSSWVGAVHHSVMRPRSRLDDGTEMAHPSPRRAAPSLTPRMETPIDGSSRAFALTR